MGRCTSSLGISAKLLSCLLILMLSRVFARSLSTGLVKREVDNGDILPDGLGWGQIRVQIEHFLKVSARFD